MDWRLSFTGWQSPGWRISVIVGVVIAVCLCISLIRYERHLVSAKVGRALLCLRMLILLTLLITFMKPIRTRTADTGQPTRLVIGVDVSDSMSTADRHATPSEMLRWAQALGMLGNDSTAELIEQWTAAYDAGAEPNWSAKDADGIPDNELGTMRRKHVEGVFTEIGAMPRLEFVRRLLEAQPNALLKQLQKTQSVELRAFATDQQSVEPAQLRALLNSDREELGVSGTDAAGILTGAMSDDGNQVSGIVLFTDGRQTIRKDVIAESSRLGSLQIPVFCVPIGSRYPPRDLSFAGIDVPDTVFLDDTAFMRATLTSAGYSGEDIQIKLLRDDKTVDQQTVSVTGDSVAVEFAIPTNETGRHEFRLTTDSKPGELRTDNNAREFSVSVVDNRAKVLLVEGDARWEFRYLHNALERDKRVELQSILFRQPFLSLLNQTSLPQQLPAGPQLSAQLADTDVLIIGDVGPDEISEDDWKLIETAVSEEGMTVVVVPGKRNMPHRFQSTTLDKLLPVTSVRQRSAERIIRSRTDAAQSSFRLVPTPDASELAMFQLTRDLAALQQDFGHLPGHPWVYSAQPSPAATVWAHAVVEVANAPVLPAVIHQYYGFGQVVWMGVDSTWRWRRRAGDAWHHRFWGQLVRWSARNKAAAGNEQVRMTLSDVVPDDTEGIDVSVRWNPKLVPQLVDVTLQAVVTSLDHPDTESTRFSLLPVASFPERYATRIPRMQAGRYTVSLEVSGDRLQLKNSIATDIQVQKRLSSELANISCHRELLQQIAQLSGGEVLEPWALNRLEELLLPEDVSETLYQEQTLFDHWSLLLIFFGLLMTEWVIRKLSGLP